MSHIRTQIRNAVVSQVSNLETTQDRVFRDRVYNFGEHEYPCLVVACDERPDVVETERHGPATGRRRLQEREVAVSVTAYDRVDEVQPDVLDDIAEQVEVAMGSDLTLGGLAIDVRLASVATSTVADGTGPVGAIRMVYVVRTRTREGQPAARA